MAKGTTYADGKVRQRLLAEHVDGTPCDRCWLPMYHDRHYWLNCDGRKLHAAHPHDRPRSRYPRQMATHLEHARCNQEAGNGVTRWTPLATSTSREW